MKRIYCSALLVAMVSTVLLGQEEEQRPPERGVARISLLNGEVSVRRGDSGDVMAAAVNAPLILEDRLLTNSSSRAEIQFDSSNVLRVGANSEVRMGDLQYKQFKAQLALGTFTYRVLRAGDGQAELDTPVVGIRPLRPGVYRITIREDGSTELTVREGEAEVLSHGGSERIQAGSTLLARGSADDPEFQIVAELGGDDWDRWNSDRDRDLEHSRSYQYVSRDIEGAEELDQHGRWLNDPTYGNVWQPTVAPGWAPYQSGRWVWEDYYGWTWISADPWGWAPYHYGRWFNGSVGWCWYPGPVYGRHYWSPALVGFFGFGGGGGFHAGFGFGNVGWVPLAPFESFRPWWGRGFNGGRNSFSNTTIVNNTNITNVYRNARYANGVTSVNASNFGRGGGQFSSMSGANVRDAGVVRGGLPVTPDRSSLRFSDRQAQTAGLPQSRAGQFYNRGGNVQSQRTPFNQQSGAAGSTRGGWQNSPGDQTSSGSHGWQRFGQPVHGVGSSAAGSGVSQNASRGQASGGSSWQRFGGTSNPSGNVNGGYQNPRSVQSQPQQDSSAPRGGSSRGGGYQSYPQSSPRSQSGPDYQNPRSSAPSQPQQDYSAPRGGSSRGGGYQSYPQSSPRPAVQSQPQQNYSPRGSGSGWSGGSSRGGGYQSSPQPGPQSQPAQYQSPRYQAPRSFGGSYGGGSQPVRISPPMVHERSAPSNSAPRGGGGNGGSSRGAGDNSGGSSHGRGR